MHRFAGVDIWHQFSSLILFILRVLGYILPFLFLLSMLHLFVFAFCPVEIPDEYAIALIERIFSVFLQCSHFLSYFHDTFIFSAAS